MRATKRGREIPAPLPVTPPRPVRPVLPSPVTIGNRLIHKQLRERSATDCYLSGVTGRHPSLRQCVPLTEGSRRQPNENQVVARLRHGSWLFARPWHATCSAGDSDTGDQSEESSDQERGQRGEVAIPQAAGRESSTSTRGRSSEIRSGCRLESDELAALMPLFGARTHEVRQALRAQRERGESSLDSVGVSLMKKWFVAKKKSNTPGQRSRESNGVLPGHPLFSREEAAREVDFGSLCEAAFSHVVTLLGWLGPVPGRDPPGPGPVAGVRRRRPGRAVGFGPSRVLTAHSGLSILPLLFTIHELRGPLA
jgi:hypothetical protein